MENNNIDIRALIGTSEKETHSQLLSLGYTFHEKVVSPHQNPSLEKQYISFYRIFDTQVVATIVKEKCLAIGVMAPEINEALKDWIEKNTQIDPNAKLRSPLPPGVHAEVRMDDYFWYSIRSGENVYNVSVTSKMPNEFVLK
jgi:hypothetical protein